MAKKKGGKKWYESVTLWANAVMLLGTVAQVCFGEVIADPQVQLGIGVVVNILLRLKTGQPIELGNLTK